MDRIPLISPLAHPVNDSGDVVAEAIAMAKKATELKDVAIAKLLAQREQINRDLATLGYAANGSKATGTVIGRTVYAPGARRNFRDLTLAQIGKLLLKERGELHGKDIERLAREGGFKHGTKKFQNYLPVAFKRDGGFVNVGGNRWKLKEPGQE
jgi:hypothetical protein